LAKGFIEKCKRVLHLLISETIVFTSGVQLAETHPEAAISLSKACVKLVSEAMGYLRNCEKMDEYIKKACNELEIAKDLFMSVISGEPASVVAMKFIPRGAEDNRVLVLDIAHSHTHKAIDFLKNSENFESNFEVLNLLSEARRESAPTTLYKLAYKMART